MSGLPPNDKSHNEMVCSPKAPSSHTIPRRNSLRLLTTTPHIPVPPSLRKSPYLTCSAFSCALASPIPPSDEDEKWLQDTIPLPSRHHLQVTGASGPGGPAKSRSTDRKGSEKHLSQEAVSGQRGAAAVAQKGVAQTCQEDYECRHISSSRPGGLGATEASRPRPSNFVPPSLEFISDNSKLINVGWPAVLCSRRWSTGPLLPPNPDNSVGKLIR